jgi:hypothetical protein
MHGAVLFKRICQNDDERSVEGVAEMATLGLNLDRGIFKDSGRYGYGSRWLLTLKAGRTPWTVIGCVKMGKWWGVIDQGFGPLWVNIYDLQEPEYESEDNFSILRM